MALAATLLPSGSVRSVMDRTTLGLARAGSFTSSDTCSHTQEQNWASWRMRYQRTRNRWTLPENSYTFAVDLVGVSHDSNYYFKGKKNPKVIPIRPYATVTIIQLISSCLTSPFQFLILPAHNSPLWRAWTAGCSHGSPALGTQRTPQWNSAQTVSEGPPFWSPRSTK